MILCDHNFSADLVFENKRTREGTILEIEVCLDQIEPEKKTGGKTN